MTKEFLSHSSIIIESIAFFLVTIDLYGKERLDKLRNRIKGINPNRKIEGVSGIILRTISAIIYTFIFYAILYFLLKRWMFIPDFNKSIGYNFIETYAHPRIGDIITIIIALITGWNFRIFLVKIPRSIIIYLLRFFIYAITLFPFQGIMLTVGTFLFITAKVLAYYSV